MTSKSIENIKLVSTIKFASVSRFRSHFFQDFNDPHTIIKSRVTYNTKKPKNYNIKKVKNKEIALTFYKKMNEGKKFVFFPDLDFFALWIQNYPTFLIYFEKKIVGIFSFNSIYCRMQNGFRWKIMFTNFI